MKEFLKYFWQDTGNKVFCIFFVAFVVIFHGLGSLIPSIGMRWRDIFPMYIIFGAIFLTLLTYSISKYLHQGGNEQDDKIVIRGNQK